ncbi:hypothetical protein FQA39_LY05032 [Lamprigera yunnana]|nr:hypothetical protein FQA39_LY05032 [Lamprigera yunnana]
MKYDLLNMHDIIVKVRPKSKVSKLEPLSFKTNTTEMPINFDIVVQEDDLLNDDEDHYSPTIFVNEHLQNTLKTVVDLCESKYHADSQELYPGDSPSIFINKILQNNIESIVNLCENMNNISYTKKGTKRKRKKYEASLPKRKKQKRDLTVSKHSLQKGCNTVCLEKCSTKITNEGGKS